MLQKLVESIHILHGVLQVWQAGRMALTEVQEVFESIGQWLALAVDLCGSSNSAGRSVITESRAIQILLKDEHQLRG